MAIEKLKLPKGRIVGGHPVKSEDKLNFQTKKPVLADDGSKVQQWRVEYAIPKDVFLAEVWPYMVQEAATLYPIDPSTGQPRVNQDFSWKMVDGDSNKCPKGSQVPYNTREGYPGHYVLTIKTEAFAPGCWKFVNGGYYEVQENEIKVGDYIVANIDIRAHSNNSGGLYLNPNIFELVEIGQPIKTSGSANPEQLLGESGNSAPGAIPAQAGMPQAAAPQAAPAQAGMPQAAAPQAAPAQAGMPQAAAPQAAPAQAGMPPPAHDFVQNAGMPQAPQPQGAASVAGGMPQAVSASPATTSPTDNTQGIPGLPQSR